MGTPVATFVAAEAAGVLGNGRIPPLEFVGGFWLCFAVVRWLAWSILR